MKEKYLRVCFFSHRPLAPARRATFWIDYKPSRNKQLGGFAPKHPAGAMVPCTCFNEAEKWLPLF